MPEEKPTQEQPNPAQPSAIEEHLSDVMGKALTKIDGADSILVALSKDPSVDEMAAAIALTLFLDGIGKHATAIYSGATPNALQFLKPEETFEPNTNSLQDFIIALNKDKADHLRYKIEGDFVKVYITPYRTTLDEGDLEFSHGDFNVDLVVAFDVESGEDLDGALSEYGRIMHDATAINITINAPGRFAEVEWSDQQASSVCEMVYRMIMGMGDKANTMQSDVATALLTGIVASTEKFSNDRTTPETMSVAAKLMEAGADQQLISSNIVKEGTTDAPENAEEQEQPDENGVLSVEREEDENETQDAQPTEAEQAEQQLEQMTAAPEEAPIMAELQQAAAEAEPVAVEPVPEVPAVTAVPPVPVVPEVPAAPVEIPTGEVEAAPVTPVSPAPQPVVAEPVAEPSAHVIAPTENSVAPAEVHAAENPVATQATMNIPDMVDLAPTEADSGITDYGKMMEEELAKPLPVELEQQAAAQAAAQPTVITSPIENPAAAAAPEVPAVPEIPVVPPVPAAPDGAILPPPPAPPVDLNAPGVMPEPPVLEVQQTVAQPVSEVAPQPVAPAADPGAFQIPVQ